MEPARSGVCRRDTCANAVPQDLAAQQLCLDHFLDEAYQRTERAMERCRSGQAIDVKGLEWLLADALAIVNRLESEVEEKEEVQRDRMLELLLILANLHEYVAHGSMRVIRTA